MSAYLVTFDLNRQGQNYDGVVEAIKSYGTWAKVATTTFVIVTSSSAGQIRDKLQAKIDSNDELFVAKLSGEAAWYGLSDSVSKWLQENL